MIRFYLLTLFVLNVQVIWAQNFTGQVLDSETREPIPFVAIVDKASQNGVYTDLDGKFSLAISNETKALEVMYVGYEHQTLAPPFASPKTILLKSNHVDLNEVVIRPGVNPAEIIMQKVIDAKGKNDPEGDRSFSYKSYNKFVFKLDIDSTKLTADQLSDTSFTGMLDFFSDSHIMLTESATERKYMPPARSVENIIANRISGLSSPDFALLATELQSFSFYGETFKVSDTHYLSPLAQSAIRKYLFILEETTVIHTDTIYTISFRPRKRTNFEGMKGQLFIHTNGYALQQVVAEPAEQQEGLQVKIEQQYQRIQEKWFPYQLNAFLTMPSMSVNSLPMVGVGRSYVTDVRFDIDSPSSDFGPIVLTMDQKAKSRTELEWDSLRYVPLSEIERNTYWKIDSIGKESNLDKKMKLAEMAFTGKIPLGKFSLDLDKVMAFNDYEGFRLGAGIHTNDFLWDKGSIGGYYGYGFRDRGHKYGADALLHLYKKRNAWLKLSYENDVREMSAGMLEHPFSGFFKRGIYPFFVSRMDRFEKWEARASGRVLGNLSAQVFLNDQFIKSFGDYGFVQSSTEGVTLIADEYFTTEAGLILRWAPGERLARMGNREIRLGGRFPVFNFSYTRGMQNVGRGDFDYDRLEMMIEKTFDVVNVGKLTLRATGGWTPDDVPLSFLYLARGTNRADFENQRFLSIAAPFTFETMRTNEFVHSEFVGFHLRHQFKDLLLKGKKFRPYLSLVQNVLWGNLNNAQSHTFATASANKGYYESGLVIDRLIGSNFSGLGIGVFYRYGTYAFDNTIDNFAFKLSSNITF
jgi:hypothetical protein